MKFSSALQSTVIKLCFYTSLPCLFWPIAISASPIETAVQYIKLAAPLADRDAEISGLTWCGSTLFILPQFPDFVARRKVDKPAKGDAIKGESYLYTIEKQQLDDYLQGKSDQPIGAKALALDEKKIRKAAPKFDGFEAIVCKGKKLWFAIETSDSLGQFMTHVVAARLVTDNLVEIDPLPLAEVPSISGRHNGSNETLLLKKNKLLSIHEVNEGSSSAPSSASLIDTRTTKRKAVSFPAIAHRITDATSIDQQGKFWVINYGFGDDPHLANTNDELLADYGVGATHKLEDNVERLLQLKITNKGVELTDQAPIPLKLTQENGRNWEGVVRYEFTDPSEKISRGLLIVTDKHPQTYFGFVALPNASFSPPANLLENIKH